MSTSFLRLPQVRERIGLSRASCIRGLTLASPSLTQGGSRMPESGSFGSERGVFGNGHPYRTMDREGKDSVLG